MPLAAAATAVIALQTASASLRTAIHATTRIYEDALYYGDFQAFLARAALRSRRARATGSTDPFDEIQLDRVSLQLPGPRPTPFGRRRSA